MTTTYALVADIEQELKELFPDGFDGTTDPTDTEVTAKIAEVTTGLRVRVIRAIGREPLTGEDGESLIKRGVVSKVVAWILRKKMVGYDAREIEASTKPYRDDYVEVLKEIELLPDMFQQTVVEGRHIGRTSKFNTRQPILADDAVGRTDTF